MQRLREEFRIFASRMKRIATLCIALLPLALYAQRVEIMVEGNPAAMALHTTQTEIRPGWKISDFQMKDRTIRYLNGQHATQLADSPRPSFVIIPGDKETLLQYAIMRVRHKRGYRTFYKAQLDRNSFMRVTPDDFQIEAYGENGFKCRPLSPLPKGDYVLLNVEQSPVGKMGDYQCYPFRVE